MQHPVTSIALTSCILSVVYLVLYSPEPGGVLGAVILLIMSGLVAGVSFFWLYSVRYNVAYSRMAQVV